ncbi:MAG TPA: hypothetical protein DCZ59_10665 [Bacteroidetes bacterium]|nr:hypothetical protein [Bacteroidota bacterium]
MCARMYGIIVFVCAAAVLSAQTGPKDQINGSGVSWTQKPPAAEQNDNRLVRALGIECEARPEGIVITDVYVTMPAYSAGLCIGDILLAIDQRPITTQQQANDRTRNIRAAHVMVDLQRRDMRISRRVEVADGHRQMLGFASNDDVVALSFRSLDASVLSELAQVGFTLQRNAPKCLVVDLRRVAAASDAAGSVQEIEQTLRKIIGADPDLQLIVLRSDVLDGPARELASVLLASSGARMHNASGGTFIRRDVGRPGRSDGARAAAALPAVSPSATPVAPVQWNMADFRSHYPAPDPVAMMHPMMSEHAGMAPIAWGLNGTAWEALVIAGPMI